MLGKAPGNAGLSTSRGFVDMKMALWSVQVQAPGPALGPEPILVLGLELGAEMRPE